MRHRRDGTIGRRDFARVALGTLGAATAAAPEAWQTKPDGTPTIKLCVRSSALATGCPIRDALNNQ
ncbi:MAG: hypothetical protein ABIX28_16335 [Vicinamibacterales bacterium]